MTLTAQSFIAMLTLLLSTCGVVSQSTVGNTVLAETQNNLQTIHNLPGLPEEQVDVGLWALVISRELDSTVDVAAGLLQLELMAAEIRRMLAGRQRDIEVISMIKTFLYEKGPWNAWNPFAYNLEDPLGRSIGNQLLSNYLKTRRGSCLTMPVLFTALVQRINPDIRFTVVRAPLHLFCRLRDRQSGDVWNIETTNGGLPMRNQQYIDALQIPREAIDSGLYLQDLKKKELLADLMQPLILYFRQNRDYQQALKYTDLALQLDPLSTVGLVNKGAIQATLGHALVKRAEGENRALTTEEADQVARYQQLSRRLINRAFALGWQPQDQRQQQNYLSTFQLRSDPENSPSGGKGNPHPEKD